MAEIAVEEVALDGSGRLLVVPASGSDQMYPFIYRAGNGVTWLPAERAFVASEPSRWAHAELLAHIIETVDDECGDTLRINEATRWQNIPAGLAPALRACFR